MIILSESIQYIDPYLYKLLLSITISNMGLGKVQFPVKINLKGHDGSVFDTLVMCDLSVFEQYYKRIYPNSDKTPGIVEIFDVLIKELYPVRANDIKLRFADELFRVSLGDIMRKFVLTPNMDSKLKYFLMLRITVNNLGEGDWQEIKKDLVDFITNSVPLEDSNYGRGSSLIGLLKKSVMFFVNQYSSKIFGIINRTGMNSVINEDGLTMGHFNLINVAEHKVDIDLQSVLSDIYKLNAILYKHMFTGTDRSIVFYDAISKYKLDELREYAQVINSLYEKFFKNPTAKSVLAIDLYRMTEETENAGTRIKAKHNDELLDILRPIILDGLHPSQVDLYARRIFLHVTQKQSGSASSVFNVAPKANTNTGYYNSSFVYRNPSEQAKMQDIIIGAVAINKLLYYIHSQKLTIFDLDSRIFRDVIYTYRFKSITECLDLFPTVHELVCRVESAVDIDRAEDNGLLENDDEDLIAKIKSRQHNINYSINCANIVQSLGEMSASDNNKKAKASSQNISGLVYQKLYNLGITVQKGITDVVSAQEYLGKLPIQLLRFVASINKEMDFITALNLEVFSANNITAPLAVEPIVDIYYPKPSHTFEEYCANSASVVKFVSLFVDDLDDANDSALQVYRNCAFITVLVEAMSQLLQNILDILKDYNNNKSNKFLGVFDMFNFVSENLLISNLGYMTNIEAVHALQEQLHFNTYKTKYISTETIDSQLIVGYEFFLTYFEESLLLLKEIAAIYYHDFSNRLNGNNSLIGNESAMKLAAEQLATEPRITMDAFLRYKSFCDKNTYGFLIHRGKFHYDAELGYLHDRGYWVRLLPNGSFTTRMITDSVYFERILEALI